MFWKKNSTEDMPFAHTNSGYLKIIGPLVLFEMVMVEKKLTLTGTIKRNQRLI